MNKTAVIISLIGVAACGNLRNLADAETSCVGCTLNEKHWETSNNGSCETSAAADGEPARLTTPA